MIHEDDALTHATDYFHPFPEAEEVFTGDVEKHKEYFLSLATVELSHINPSWSSIIPIVSPIEPYEGVVGEETTEFHTYLSRDNWIAYHLRNGKIAFEGDWRLFEKDKYVEFYDETHAGYKKAKAYFKEYGCLRRDIGVGDIPENKTNLLARLGGIAKEGKLGVWWRIR